ncbi:MAG: bifunctional 4-hydroxy-2-oxoglutarate aldolase/2-dehydro-3-deoxy-phosphogluconate aldolase [Hyphomicrobiales bacterium]|nr:bifunctional 4-hydroxy-2-oxoglutarate aldolase/2-dehydro-3-deoxy-phosphogluconate aldolase [Hyphomicrobiales bacterium]
MSADLSRAAERRAKLVSLFARAPVVPVVTIANVAQAVPLARALTRGGLAAIEITLRTPAALDAAVAIRAEVPEAIVGIGTVLTPDDLARAVEIGAAFALSPGATPDLLEAARDLDLPFAPGVQTASEIMACLQRGFDIVKFFPAAPAGGISALRALSGPFPDVRFCPTGGVSEKDATDWLAQPNVIAVGGSWVAPSADLASCAWDRIEARARSAAQLMKENGR